MAFKNYAGAIPTTKSAIISATDAPVVLFDLKIANQNTGTSYAFSLFFYDSSEETETTLVYLLAVPSGSTISFGKLVLEPGDELRAVTTTVGQLNYLGSASVV